MKQAPAPRLSDLSTCFTGVIPAVLATVSEAGVPNVTYLSRVHPVDGERVALSNQFFSKSKRNLIEDPRASLLLVRPETLEEYRLEIVFEQTLDRGQVFERLRNDLAMIAALTGMQDVFHLRAADIYRVVSIETLTINDWVVGDDFEPGPPGVADHAALAELSARLSRCRDLDTLVQVTVDGLDSLLGYDHSLLLLADESGERLFTIASHGYANEGVGAEVAVGDGVAGLAAARCTPIRADNLHQMTRYGRRVSTSFQEAAGVLASAREVPMPGLATPGSAVAVPALALGQLVGVILTESTRSDRFGNADVAALSVVATLVASTVERLRSEAGADTPSSPVAPATAATATGPVLSIRHFPVDGSTFFNRDYLIKGVAGKVLWTLLRQYHADGRTEFTNRELRLDPSLDLPDFRDNLESRLILLKRRLDERSSAVRIEKSGRGRFRLVVNQPVRLETPGTEGP